MLLETMVICYKDMTFCFRSRLKMHASLGDACANKFCHRFADDRVIEHANAIGLPIAYGDMLTPDCGFKFAPGQAKSKAKKANR